ncbi:MAG: YebC/PmpR family DNA-binding transcriptional regulator [bacterium]|nr:YebC/PmpR family DNA-binding transcriptional regulator [bacterium]
MSGHSKWSQIKHKKGAADQKKGQLFSKLSKKISIAAKSGADPSLNYHLQSAIDAAHSANMPKDNIERAIKRGSDKNLAELKEITVQALLGSVAIIIVAITDNSNRTIGDIKNILTKHSAKMAEAGSLDWLFEKKSIIEAVPNSKPDGSPGRQLLDEASELALIDSGADDIQLQKDRITVLAAPEHLHQIKEALGQLGFSTEYAQIDFVPKNTVTVADADTRHILDTLFEDLDNQDDVESLYSNLRAQVSNSH